MSRDGHVTVTQCHATDIDKEIDKDKEIDIKVRRFTPPTPEEVQQYCTES
jgi:hypothetical protein